jgi:hypothetical protein
MTPLGIDWIATAALTAWLGLAGPKSWKPAMALCVAIGLLGWAASYPIMVLAPSFGGDASLSVDYFDDFSARNAAAEIGVALTWSLIWFGLARLARFLVGRGRKQAS